MEYFVCYVDTEKAEGNISTSMLNCVISMPKEVVSAQDISDMKLAVADGVQEKKSKIVIVNYIKLG